jgi:tetratricopeptide (TPR) repeat protein
MLLPWACAGLLAQSGDARTQSADELLQWWVGVAANHTPGGADEAAEAVGGLSKDQLLSILSSVTDAVSPNRAIRLGAVLHVDVALRVQARATGALFPSYASTGAAPPVPFVVLDGTGAGLGVSSTHVEFARALIRKLQPLQARRDFARVWYAGTAAELARRRDFAELDVHLDHARDLLPDDADILLASGCLHEAFAGSTAQAAAQQRASLRIGGRSTNLRRAERYFRQALSVDPGLTEARLRLGRVLDLQNRHKEAVTELRRAIDSAEDSNQAYFSYLFLGRAQESLGQLAAAHASFRRASELYPFAQSPALALSRLAVQRGDDQGARRVLQNALNLRSDDPRSLDPWWIYGIGPGRYADTKLSELYETVLEER